MKCAIITPIGPGHLDLYQEAKNSVEAAFANNKGAFDEIIFKAMDDTDAVHGRSNRRNDAIKECLAQGVEWLFFLDADDFMHPDAFATAQPFMDQYDGIWGQIVEHSGPDLRHAKPRDGQMGQSDNVLDVLAISPFLTLQMGHFVRTDIAAKVLFDPTLDTGEDFKYYLQVWWDNKCIKLDQPLFINRRGMHSTGSRAATGVDWNNSISKVFLEFCLARNIVMGVTVNEWETKFRVPSTQDVIHQFILRGKFFEFDQLVYAAKQIGQGKTIIDVGSNVGNHALFYLAYLKPKDLICVEPNPINQGVFEENMRQNMIMADRYQLWRKALGDKKTKGRIAVENFMSLKDGVFHEDPGGDVECVRLDDELSSKIRPDFMRIDMKGRAFDVLAGAVKTIRKAKPDILLTIDTDQNSQFGEWLDKNRYESLQSFQTYEATQFYCRASKG